MGKSLKKWTTVALSFAVACAAVLPMTAFAAEGDVAEVDGTGYRTDVEPCQALSSLAEQLVGVQVKIFTDLYGLLADGNFLQIHFKACARTFRHLPEGREYAALGNIVHG